MWLIKPVGDDKSDFSTPANENTRDSLQETLN